MFELVKGTQAASLYIAKEADDLRDFPTWQKNPERY